MWFLAVLFVGSLVASLLLMPKPKIENARPQGLDDLQYPRAEEGAPVPLILGRGRLRGPNTLWVGDFEARPIKKKQKTGLFSSKKVIVGHEYFIGLQLGLALGPNTLHTIWSDKDILWSGNASGVSAININLPDLYGGKEKGGGFVGTLRFYTGDFAQGVNAYVEGKIGAGAVPAYRGKSVLVFEKVNIGEQNSLRQLSLELSRYTNGLALAGGMNQIGDDLNPMEVLFQVFTLEWGGLDVPISMIDTDSWKECAETLYNEQNGMSVVISTPNGGKEVASEVLRQVDGILYSNVQTGKIVAKLIRNDYEIEDLPVFDESNIIAIRKFTSKLWEDTINQVRVTYTDRSKKYEKGSAFEQDMANIHAQERVRSITNSYPGVNVGILATKLAKRDLAQGSIPLLSAEIEMNREGQALKPGDVFVWAWDAYDIAQSVLRVRKFDLGALTDNRIVVECSQDEFAVRNTLFEAPDGEGSSAELPNDPAIASTKRFVLEGAYWFAQAAGFSVGEGSSFVMVSAKAPTASEEYDVYTSDDAGASYDPSEEGIVYAPYGDLNTAIDASTGLDDGIFGSITITTSSDEIVSVTADQIASGASLFYIGSELFAHQGVVDNGDGTLTLQNCRRALLDTVPAAHIVGAGVFFMAGDTIVDDLFPNDAALRVKVTPRTFSQALDVATAPYDSVTLKARPARPLRPARVQFDGGTVLAPPAVGTGSKTVTWANRSRLSPTILHVADATNEFEPGQQTVFRFRLNGGAWTEALIAPGETSYTFDAAAGGGDTVDYEIYSTRDGLDSFSRWTFTAGAAAAGGSSPDTGGGDPADDQDDYVIPGVPYSTPFGFTDAPIASEVLLIHVFPEDVNFADDFAGSRGTIGTNPAASFTLTVAKNGANIGTIVVSTGGAVTFATTGGAVSFAAGDRLTVTGPLSPDAAIANCAFTFTGERA